MKWKLKFFLTRGREEKKEKSDDDDDDEKEMCDVLNTGEMKKV